jgi:putative drug exporter of the RND superfamily
MFKILAELVSKRPWWVLGTWFVLLLIAAYPASLAPKRLVSNASSVPNSEAQKVIDTLAKDFGQKRVDRTIIVSRSSLSANDPRFLDGYNSLVGRLKTVKGVNTLTRFDAPSALKLRNDLAQGGQGPVKPTDGIITATILETNLDHPERILEEIRLEVRSLKIPGTEFFVTGSSAVSKDFIERSEADTKRSEFGALPLTGLVLIFAFGALVAAGLPLLVGVISITISMGFLFGLTQFMEVSSFAGSVITLLGLGAGIDYALLIVNRFREELRNGLEPPQAAANTVRTAGRSVAFSGLTVAIAMGALLIPNLTFVRSMGIGGVMVVIVTVLCSITAVPAVLAIIGERVNSPRKLKIPFTSSGAINPFWGVWATRVMARPWISSLVSAAIIIALALPAFGMKLGYTGAFGLSSKVESRRGLELIRPIELGGALDTFEVLLDLGKAGGFDSDARRNFRRLDLTLNAMPDVRLVISPFIVSRSDFDGGGGLGDLVDLTKRSISSDRRYLHLSVIPKEPIRADLITAWESRIRGAASDAGFQTVLLGGSPVGAREFTDTLVNAIPLAIGVVFAATFVLLAIAFRSLIIPLKSIIMNTLTVGASYGIITMVFQYGWGASLLQIPTDLGVIDSSLPLVMFAVTFGLSMDYEIFLLSRVQEAHLAGLDTRAAIRQAVERTAGVITSAALIMLIVFGAFVQGDVVANKTIGVGLAVAVFLDATLVRLVMVPAVLVLAGEWNWWLPKPLQKVMPKVSLEH